MKFNDEERAPVVLPECGHTFCEYCVADMLTEAEKQCPNCQSEIKTTDTSKYFKNHKILALLQREAPE